MRLNKKINLVLIAFSVLLVFACSKKDKPDVEAIVFKHGKIAGDPALFTKLLKRFEAENPGITVRDEILPASTDEQHQYYVINLGSQAADFDVLSIDVIWVQEFARAGWLTDVSLLLPVEERKDFFPGPLQAVTYQDKLYALPWYIDAGLLYYRQDLLEKYAFPPPKTWDELVRCAKTITSLEPGVYGFIWQGKQYEGLVCNALEYMWSSGGEVIKDGKSVVYSKENIAALEFMRNLIVKHKITPELVTTAIEEPTRHIFGQGKALFMRNWPYAWNIFQRDDSIVKGKIGVSMLPAFPNHEPVSTLGGWQLGINKYSVHPQAAEKLIKFLVSEKIQKELALSIGYKPTRMSLYQDADLLREQPYFSMLYEVFLNARPRPLSPYYMQITQVLQPEISAVLAGSKSPEEALKSIQQQVESILDTGK
jgi:multiple sugar transport system substrate-binding protein